MGASGWSYFVPYDADVARAFSRLQEDVFARGEYYSHAKIKFRSIRDLLHAQAEDGTHSILDMSRVSDDAAPRDRMASIRAYGTVFRMSDDELEKCFSSKTPTRAKIEQSASRAMDLCSRGTGRYALVFDGEVPTGIFFVGVSGD